MTGWHKSWKINRPEPRHPARGQQTKLTLTRLEALIDFVDNEKTSTPAHQLVFLVAVAQ